MTSEQLSALTAWIEAYTTEAEAFSTLVAGGPIASDADLRATLNAIADALESQVRLLRFGNGVLVDVSH